MQSSKTQKYTPTAAAKLVETHAPTAVFHCVFSPHCGLQCSQIKLFVRFCFQGLRLRGVWVGCFDSGRQTMLRAAHLRIQDSLWKLHQRCNMSEGSETLFQGWIQLPERWSCVLFCFARQSKHDITFPVWWSHKKERISMQIWELRR